jgi:shikimate kinase
MISDIFKKYRISSWLAIKQGSHNHVDPLWLRLDTLMVANNIANVNDFNLIKHDDSLASKYKIITLKSQMHSLDSAYQYLHKEATDIEPLSDMISKPFLPAWEYNKLNSYINPLLEKHLIILSGVTGSGKTTLVERLAKYITGSEKRIEKLQCVEGMGVEYHKEWIGSRDRGVFTKGRLLELFEKCKNDPKHNYIFILDDFDKIYPATFFGSEIWSELDNPLADNVIKGYGEITIPPNFYMISITHIGASNVIDLNNDHIRRLGTRLFIPADLNEFILYLQERIEKKKLKVAPVHLKKVLYFFKKTNDYIENKYGISYTLGQWSPVRNCLEPEKFKELQSAFITQVNAFKPKTEMLPSDLEPILYSIENNGLLENSNFFYGAYLELKETGMLSEVTVGLVFALVSGIFGWVLLVNKRKFVKNLHFRILNIMEKFTIGQIDYEEALKMTIEEKQHIEKLILERKINYEESTFLILFINDQIQKMDNLNKMNLVSKDFFKIFEEFMSDGILDQEEYTILTKFLDNIRSALSPEIYYTLRNKIDAIRSNSL